MFEMPLLTAMVLPSHLLWRLGWLLLVLTASILVLEAQRSRHESRLHREFRLGCTLIPSGAVLGLVLASWAWLSGKLPKDAAEEVATAIVAGSVLGVGGCIAYWWSGLVMQDLGLGRPLDDGDEGKPPPSKSEGVGDREIDGAP